MRRVVILKLYPRNEFSQPDPAIVIREFARKRQYEVLEREVLTRLTPVYVENSWTTYGLEIVY